ncbi:S8 family serine peptidase [Jiella avicenniae]|uniref:S8 family serine peptidase n=1 Tax=Jiella avicenniae TaxID=2907202 RepID=A0A9X1T564_9HYPH|nr:S8 family serine peptidase [Jiella avicenniae]MCE7029321.1 S8 family serine peptidase [Jiella avicenniae]
MRVEILCGTVLRTVLAATTALVAPNMVCSVAAQPLSAVNLDVQADDGAAIERALAEAANHGDRSLVASVIENTRLTPWRSARLLDAARAQAPSLTTKLERASQAGLELARRTYVDRAEATDEPLPPGGDGWVPIEDVSEEDRNFGWRMIGADKADELGLTGAGVTVGIVDTGIDVRPDGMTHPEFEGRVDPRSYSDLFWVNKHLTLTRLPDGSFDPASVAAMFDQLAVNGSMDVDGHGTHVTGIIGAGHNGFGMVGVAPGANLLGIGAIATGGVVTTPDGEPIMINGEPLTFGALNYCGPQFLDGGRCDVREGMPSASATAIDYLATQADVRVANGSFGPFVAAGAVTSDISNDLQDGEAVRRFVEAGKIWVSAAGNEYGEAPVAASNPSGIGLLPFVSPDTADARNDNGDLIYEGGDENTDFSDLTPEALAAREADTGEALGRVVVVVAVDAAKQIASYSNRCGVTADWCLAAPGGDTYFDADNFRSLRGIFSTVPVDVAETQEIEPGAGYDIYQGTSMAAPHVAGALAILIEAYPHFAPGKLVDIMFQTAEDLGEAGVDVVYGQGLLRLDRALSGPIGIDPNSTDDYVTDIPFDHEWLFDFASAGGMVKAGDGTLAVGREAAVAFAGQTSVEDGTFQIDGYYQTAGTEVGANGTLGGTGLIASDVTVAGTLAPGNSPGTLTVAGNVTLTPTARTEIEVDGAGTGNGAGNYDRLVLLGNGSTFTADGILAPTLRGISAPATNAYTPPLGMPYSIVLASDGQVAGSFDGIEQPTAGLLTGSRFDVVYGSQSIALVATPSDYRDLAALGLSESEAARAIGGALQSLRPTAGVRPSDDVAALLDPVYLASADQLAAGLDASAGTIYVDAGQESLRSIGRFADTIGHHQRDGQFAKDGATADPFWSAVIGSSVDVDDAGEGYEAKTGGFVLGAEGELGSTFAGLESVWLGGALSYTRTDLDDDHGSADLDAYQAALYGSARLDAFVLRGSLGFGHVEADLVRSTLLSGKNASPDGNGGFAEVSLGLPLASEVGTFLPSVGVGYRGFRRGSVSEDGAFGLDLAAKTFEEGYVTAGLAWQQSYLLNGVTLKPTVSLAYRGDFLDIADSQSATLLGAGFESAGADIGANALLASAGAEIAFSDQLSAGLRYETEQRAHLSEHAVKFDFSLRW